jgi:integrase
MPTMGRKPTKNLNLPPRLRARPQKSGKVYYYYDAGGKPRRELPLGSDYIAAVRKWAELEGQGKFIAAQTITLKALADEYRRVVIPTKAARTQKDNNAELDNLLAFFGAEFPIDEIRPVHVTQYLKHRSAAPIRATREKALLSHMLNKAREWGLTDNANPCAGIKGTSAGRDVYIEDAVFAAVYQAACQPVRDAMDIAYLAGQRVTDTLAMSEADIRDGYLHVAQGKTGKRLRIAVEGQLNDVIERVKKQKEPHKVRTLRLVCNEYGRPIRIQALQTRFQRARTRAIKAHPKLADEIRQFQLRDLRAKAGTDIGNLQDAQRLLGHSTVTMTEHYTRNRIGDFVHPLK